MVSPFRTCRHRHGLGSEDGWPADAIGILRSPGSSSPMGLSICVIFLPAANGAVVCFVLAATRPTPSGNLHIT